MKKIENKLTLHINIDRDILALFDSAYPACRRRFIENALDIASQDKLFFDKIFFKDLLSDKSNNL